MKIAATALLATAFSTAVHGAEVRLDKLDKFDVERHLLGVNVVVDAGKGCAPGADTLRVFYESYLEEAGFRTGQAKNSDLEFAVSVVGLHNPGGKNCGLKVLSMVRQIPEMKILRLSPASKSTQYRLWQMENIVSGPADGMKALLESRAREDVTEFFWTYVRTIQ